jgi:hypothetical protein
MNLKQLQKAVGQKVLAEQNGILMVGQLLAVRQLFGRVEGQVSLPKGSKPEYRWYTGAKISPLTKITQL